MEELLIYLYELCFGNLYSVQSMPIPLLAVGAAIKGIGAIVGGIFGSSRARRAARKAAAEKKRLTGELKSLESSRQSVINPYENTKDLSSLAKDLSGNLSNPFANLSVATGAADMQAEQSDIALANTLDTLRASGASAGGASRGAGSGGAVIELGIMGVETAGPLDASAAKILLRMTQSCLSRCCRDTNSNVTIALVSVMSLSCLAIGRSGPTRRSTCFKPSSACFSTWRRRVNTVGSDECPIQ